MSSILLRSDHEGAKAGTVVSVPWGKGRHLIKTGIGEWHDASKHPPVMKALPALPAPPLPLKTTPPLELATGGGHAPIELATGGGGGGGLEVPLLPPQPSKLNLKTK